MKKFFYTLLIAFSLSSTLVMAQPCDPFIDPTCETDPDNPVPLDGGVSILIGMGTLYGIKKLYKNKQKQPC